MANTSKIEEALQQLYSVNDPQTIHQLQEWLTGMQTSLDAWQFCWPLMAEDKLFSVIIAVIYEPTSFSLIYVHSICANESNDTLVNTVAEDVISAPPIQFFGACTIKTKISTCWSELPADQYIPLRDQIIQFIIRFAIGPPFVRCQLCSALAILTLRITPNHWAQPINDLILFSSQQINFQAVFIEIISEITSMFDKSGLVNIDRASVRHVLESNYADDGLIPTLFDLLRDEELFESAISALMEIGTSGESTRYPSSLYRFLKLLTKLTPLIEETIRNESIDECGDICNLVVSSSECHSKYFVKFENHDHRKLANELASMILNFASTNGYYPMDETCSRLTFEFWYSLQTEIECLETANTELSRKQLAACYEDYKPMYISLMKMLTNRFLQSECLKYYCEDLSNLTSNIQSSDWQTFEVYLYLVRAISDSVSSSDSKYIRNFFRILPQLPSHEKVGVMALKVIGSYCDYLKYDHEILMAIMPRILWSLKEPKLVYAAAIALRDICVDCGEELKTSATEIFNACQEVLSGSYLMPNQRIPLVESMGSIIPVMDKNSMENASSHLSRQLIEGVINIIQKPETPSSRYEIILQLKCLKAFFLTANLPSEIQPSPLLSSSEIALRTFNEILLKWIHDEQVTEIMMLFGDDESTLQTVAHLYYTLTLGTLQLLETGSNSAPDLVNAFLIFNEKAVKSSSRIVFSNASVYDKLLPFGLASMVFKESYIIKSNSRFLVEFVAKVTSSEEARRSVELYGKLIVSKIILGIAGELPRVSLRPLIDVLIELNKNCITCLARWIKELFMEDIFPCAGLSHVDKQAFQNAVLRSRARKRWLQEQAEEFALKCRGLHGTNYAKDVQSKVVR
ncbi:uncharacterized protein TRIADDRAFT_57846 [Trichoplax adhaerens]|uniref:Importin-13 n=1 Tax=Trichoplax adhaerens TaxID=10228 RepID=B3S1Q5_TRIAD|nr:hypothetical protein TRIADDRAFT_57846 [Trichoplax adhaerens]EDV23335.1 hypothetical protein TRIADDRAFT_57846 [Trichoplax adhaerens]|eukprot:XP_002114245.1 hypothetical protein TRIADDRAFT_57846 [Trichoplax adhaerens]